MIAALYTHIRWCFIFLALTSLVLQATYTASMSETHTLILSKVSPPLPFLHILVGRWLMLGA